MKVAIIHREGGADPRCVKIINTMRSAGHEVMFIGWDPNPDQEKVKAITPDVERILSLQSQLGGAGALKQFPAFLLHILRALQEFKPDAVHCVNEEISLMVLPFKHFLFKYMVTDVFDSLAYRVRTSNKLLKKVLQTLTNLSYSFSELIIVTDQRRFELVKPKYRRKTIVMENTPDVDPSIFPEKVLEGPLKICTTGLLSKSRGLARLLAAADKMDNIEIVALGILGDEYAKTEFVNHPKVKYLGKFKPIDALKVEAECDAILSFYRPESLNNIYASPNKVFDAMSVGRPVIINSETMVSKWVEEKELGYAVPYEDTEALVQVLEKVRERKNTPEFSSRVKNMYKMEYSWHVMGDRMLSFYNKL